MGYYMRHAPDATFISKSRVERLIYVHAPHAPIGEPRR